MQKLHGNGGKTLKFTSEGGEFFPVRKGATPDLKIVIKSSKWLRVVSKNVDGEELEGVCTDGEFYPIGEFMHTRDYPKNHPIAKWDGVAHEGFFTGILIKFSPEDSSLIRVGRYYN